LSNDRGNTYTNKNTTQNFTGNYKEYGKQHLKIAKLVRGVIKAIPDNKKPPRNPIQRLNTSAYPNLHQIPVMNMPPTAPTPIRETTGISKL